MTLGIAIPMYNEEGAVEQVLHQTMYVLREHQIPFTLAIVNNGSNDATGGIVDQMASHFEEIIPIHFDKNQGYGGGILAGMRTLSARNLDVIGWMWGDGQIDPGILPHLYSACQTGYQMAKINRSKRKDGLNRKIISQLYHFGMKITHNTIADINGCPKLFQQNQWIQLEAISQDWFLDAEVMLEAQKRKWSIFEYDTVMEPRYHNQSKVNTSTLFEFARNIIKWKIQNRRN